MEDYLYLIIDLILKFLINNYKEIISSLSIIVGIISLIFQKSIFKGSQKQMGHFLFGRFFTVLRNIKTKINANRCIMKYDISRASILIIIDNIEIMTNQFISDVIDGNYNEQKINDVMVQLIEKFMNALIQDLIKRNIISSEIVKIIDILYSYETPLRINFKDIMEDSYYKTIFEKVDVLLVLSEIVILNIFNSLIK